MTASKAGTLAERLEKQEEFVDLYISWIEKLSKENEHSLDWLLASPINRNQTSSRLLRDCFMLFMLKKQFASGVSPQTITCDSLELSEVIQQYVERMGARSTVVLKGEGRSGPIQWTRDLASSLRTVIAVLLRYSAARLTGTHPHPRMPIILVEVFTDQDSLQRKDIEEVYYPGLTRSLGEEEKQAIFILATPIEVKNFFRHFSGLRKRVKNLILKEDFLTLGDVLFGLIHPMRLRLLRWHSPDFLGFDLSPIVRKEIRKHSFRASQIEAILNYRCMKRMAEKGLRIRLLIDWYENQDIDRGLNSGFNKYFPASDSVGYAGYIVPRHLVHVYPLEREKQLGLVPKRIAVIGHGLKDRYKERCPSLEVITAPAFRYGNVWSRGTGRLSRRREHSILVALPYYVDDACKVLLFLESCSSLLKDFRIRLKLNPRTNVTQIRNMYGRDPGTLYELIQKDFHDCLTESDVVFTAASTAALEALATGVPVIIIANENDFILNPVPVGVHPDVWGIVGTPEELGSTLERVLDEKRTRKTQREKIFSAVRKGFFEPVTVQGTRAFLGFVA